MSAIKSNWKNPVKHSLVVTDDSESFASFMQYETGLPVWPHKGSFGYKRKFHHHEGVDLYVPEGTTIRAVEDSIVVAIEPFTGLHALSPWWEETFAILAEGDTGVVAYGEISPRPDLKVGSKFTAGDTVGHVLRVLKHDKGRPMSMLHLELYLHGTTKTVEWPAWQNEKPKELRDPTPYLLGIL